MQPETSDRALLTGRFEVGRRLAAGTFGVVYLARDRQRGTDVALKVLREATGADLYRFKREFRGLADIVHPNLVTLHELHHAGDHWFFTMEYVPGESFLDWVRPKRGEDPGSEEPPLGPDDATNTIQIPRSKMPRVERLALQLDRLVQSLPQLVDGVYALHVTGRLHRDLKPSNVRVTPQGRVVLLDFGLTSDVRQMSAEHTHEGFAVGTPLYMSPEQGEDHVLGPASDWYSVGVMLYEALTGQRPFEGQPLRVIERKRLEDPPSPRALAPDVPPHLDELCMRMLARNPAHRPDGKAILDVLQQAPSAPTLQLAANKAPRFVGRRSAIDALGQAFRDSREGRSVAAIVRGSSGMGKSALVRHFLDEVAIPSGAIVLEGRCYERESVPYKGLDSVIDALTSYLVAQPRERLDAMLPRDIQALARLFPVLKRISAVSDPSLMWIPPPDPHELRRRAFSALRWLLFKLAREVGIVIYIDDVQWDEADAATFLSDLVLHPEPPAMLLVACCRLEEEESSLLVQALRPRRPERSAEVREIQLDAFTSVEADELVASMAVGQGAPGEVATLLRESRGNPLFLSELARVRGDDASIASLDDLLARRVERLPDDARELLEVCAVAGRPMPVDVAVAAAGLSGEGTALATLQHERLLRVRSRGDRRVEPYHDRVRESAVARLSASRVCELHRRLAESFEAATQVDAESLTTHWRGAGDLGRAARWANVAAETAMNTYAFNRATALFHQVLESPELTEAERHLTKVGLAHSLSNAGRLDEAADMFGEASNEAGGTEQIDLRRHQVDQLLRRGRLAEGRVLARQVLQSVGLGMPSTRGRAVFAVLVNRFMLRLRGLDFAERPADQVPQHLLQRLDVLWSVSSGFSFIDPIVGRALQARYMRLALEVGEPLRTGLALGLDTGYRSLSGDPVWASCEEVRERGLAIADRLGEAQLRGHIQTTSGLAAMLSGRFDIALERLVEGARVLREVSEGFRFHIDISEIMRLGCLLYLGRIREMSRLLAILVREAEESGDVCMMRGLCGWRGNAAWLLQDQPDVARRNLEAVSPPRGPADDFALHDYYELHSRTQIDIYTGALDEAVARMHVEWKQLEGSLLLRIQSVRIEGQQLRGRLALAWGARQPEGSAERRAQCELVRKMAKRIEGERVPWGLALAKLLRAGAANLSGQRADAQRYLRDAIDAFSAAHMGLYMNVARRCLGSLVGGEEGQAMITDVDAWMAAEGIGAPVAVCRLFAPGCLAE